MHLLVSLWFLYIKAAVMFSEACHKIAIIWLSRTFAFDDLVIHCHYRMICINLRQYSSLRDLFHQNLSLCSPTDRKSRVWNPVGAKLYSITILRSVLYGEIIWRTCKVYYNGILCYSSRCTAHVIDNHAKDGGPGEA